MVVDVEVVDDVVVDVVVVDVVFAFVDVSDEAFRLSPSVKVVVVVVVASS